MQIAGHTSESLEHHKAARDQNRPHQTRIPQGRLHVRVQHVHRAPRHAILCGNRLRPKAAGAQARGAHVRLDRLQLQLDAVVRSAQPLQRPVRLLLATLEHQEAGRLRYVDDGEEEHHRCHRHQHRQLAPVEVRAQRERYHDAQMAGHLLDGAEEAAYVGRCDLADVHLCDHRHNGAAEAAEKCRREHRLHRLGEHGEDPGQRERHRHDRQQTTPAVLHGQAAEHAAEEGACARGLRDCYEKYVTRFGSLRSAKNSPNSDRLATQLASWSLTVNVTVLVSLVVGRSDNSCRLAMAGLA